MLRHVLVIGFAVGKAACGEGTLQGYIVGGNNAPPGKYPIVSTSDYWVLATDYSSYSVVWSCREKKSVDNTLIISYQSAWILSRTKELGTSGWAAVNTTLKDQKIPTLYLTPVDKHDCSAAADLVPFLGTLVAALSLLIAGRMS